MTNRKSTKRALLGSVMAMVLCLAMLIGATFAWFTDTASTGVNKIQAGNLDVQLVDENGNSLEGKTLEFKKAANAAEGEAVLWEPGCTYELPAVYVKNNGKLALKYKVAITGINGSAKLNEVIDWTINDADLSADHSLAAGATSEALTIKGHMQESAGNDYMNESIDGIAITVYATQDTVESDSFNNTYDANATYPVVNVTELKEALTNGGVVNVATDIRTNNSEDTAAARIVISQPTTLNLEKKIITPDNMGNNNTNFCALIVDADTTINAGENGGIDTGVNGGYGINVRNGATLTINGGYYYGGGTAVQVQKGTLIINGGTFACEPFGDLYGYNFLINCVDSAYKNGTAKVIIQGGTFINFDPSNNSAEGAAPTSWPMVTRSCLRLRPTATFGILWLLSNSLHQKERSPRNEESALLMCEVIPTRSRNLFLKQLCLEIICSSSSKNFDYPYYQSYTMGAYQNLIIGDKLSQEAHSSYYRWLVCILAYPCQVFQTISGIFERIKHAHSILANLSANSATIVLAPTIRLCPAYAGQTHAQPWNRRAYTIRQKTVLPHPSNRMRTLC